MVRDAAFEFECALEPARHQRLVAADYSSPI